MSKKEKQYANIRKRRIFSDSFKRHRVKDIVEGLISVGEVSTLYQVSTTSVYRWLYKYSPYHSRGIVQVVQMESEAEKTKKLMERVRELEAHVGRKQLEIDYLSKLIEISSEELKIDLKKNFDIQQSSIFMKTGGKEDIK